jgi:uncharacterized membrane protein
MSIPKSSLLQMTRPIYRTIISLIVTSVVYGLTGSFDQQLRLLLSYDLGVSTFLGILLFRLAIATPEDTFRIAQNAEPSNALTLFLATLFSLTSLIAVGFMVDHSQLLPKLLANLQVGLCLIAIFLSWVMVHTFFALHYAHIYYDEISEPEQEQLLYVKGLEFPNKSLVDYWDFMYYSFTIAMCYQTSDVSISSVRMRRSTLIHAILSFLYVSVIIGLVVNLISNVI